MEKILLIYGPEKGSTDKAAQKIADIIGKENVKVLSSNVAAKSDIEKFDKLIFGASTIGRDSWDAKHAEMGWDKLTYQLDEIDFTGKTVALFGLGNQIFYPDHFLDTMGIIGKKAMAKGAKIVGQWSTETYDFKESQAVVDGKFIGLALDDDNFPELTDERIQQWATQLKELL